jgi:SAM-dependent methyltransferase
MTTALSTYEAALRSGIPLKVRPVLHANLSPDLLDVPRFLAPADRTDIDLIRHCTGAVLDIGCGPGRMVAALARHGMTALGIDIAAEAVRRTRASGGRALRRNVFDPLPDEGLWGTALLLDGNVGIGGDPTRLLDRIRELLIPRGRIIVETDPDGSANHRGELIFIDHVGAQLCEAFPWARIGRQRLAQVSSSAGFVEVGSWTSDGRAFSLIMS